MAKVDVELVASHIEAWMKAQLNTRLTAITTEKGDGLTLTPVDSGAYFFEQYDQERIGQFNPAILYGFEDMRVVDAPGSATAVTVKMSIALILTDSGDPDIMKRLLRYQRALQEIFQDGWNSVSGSLKFAVGGVAPVPVSLTGRSERDRVIGITLEFTLA